MIEEFFYDEPVKYTIVTELPEDLPSHIEPAPSLDGKSWLLTGLYDGEQITETEAREWVKSNTPAGEI